MIKLDKVSKKFGTGVLGLSDINFNIEKNEFVFLIGPTGSGKTTIFKLLIKDIIPSEGRVIVNDWDIVKLPKNKIPHLRKKIGVVFQDLRLLMDRTIFENVILPLEVSGVSPNEAIERVEEVLAHVGIIDHKDKFPIQLSGGELQKAAIARALVLSPEILLADEPTGNLDAVTSWEIVKLLSDINEKGTTVIMATHNVDIVKSMKRRVVGLEKGKIVRNDPPVGEAGKKKKDESVKHKITPESKLVEEKSEEDEKKEHLGKRNADIEDKEKKGKEK